MTERTQEEDWAGRWDATERTQSGETLGKGKVARGPTESSESERGKERKLPRRQTAPSKAHILLGAAMTLEARCKRRERGGIT